jgi:hypothetical protein
VKAKLLPILLFSLVLFPAEGRSEPSFDKARAEFGRLLRAGTAEERARGVYALDGFDRPEAVRLLARAVLTRTDRAIVIRSAQKLISAMRSEASSKVIAEEATKGLWLKRARLLESMGRSEYPAVIDALLAGCYDDDPRVRTSALLALDMAKTERADLALGDALRAPQWTVRAAAIDSLRRRRHPETAGVLVDCLASESGRLRGDLATTLRVITDQNIGVFPEAWRNWRIAGEGGVPPPLGEAKPIPPTAELAGVRTWARRVVFVLALSDSMNRKLRASPDSLPPPDVKERGGEELRKWREATTKIELARLWVVWGISHLSPEVRFDVVTYGQGVDAAFGELVPATPQNREKAADRIRSLSASGMANLHAGLSKVFDLVSRDPLDTRSLEEGPEVVFFVSDGSSDYGEIKDGFAALDEAEQLNQHRQIVFNCFGIGEHDSRILGTLTGFGLGGELIALP